MPEACLTFSSLALGYDGQSAVHDLSGTVRRGALMAVVGPNGSGKSTLLKGIVGLLRPMTGSCVVRPGTRMAYLPQSSELDCSFPARVIDLVSLGLWARRGLLRPHLNEDRVALAAALTAVGLSGLETRSLDTLSGGQLQRALFARVLVQDADLILLDEPFNAVDSRTVEDLLLLIQHWHREHRTVLVVVHDLDLVREHFPESLLLAQRPVAWGDTAEVLTPSNLVSARNLQQVGGDLPSSVISRIERSPLPNHPDQPRRVS